ncbi:uncharacterized protein [Antedon mediterranea]|uniref:uncharacterized protein n=1 Tax=Antedon mediterranea TaxID=105859 RepID=UPI003AF4BBBD
MVWKLLLCRDIIVKHAKFATIANGPMNTTEIKGETVELKCDADYVFRSSNVVWFHNSSGTKISKNYDVLFNESTKSERYSIQNSGGYANKVYNLQITNFSSEDAGLYSCSIVKQNDEQIVDSTWAVLSINPPGHMTPPTSSLTCSIDTMDAEIGDEIMITCQCEGGDPPPLLSLLIDGEEETESIYTQNQVHTLTRSISLTENHIDVLFKCKMVSAALISPGYCSIKPLPVVSIVPFQPSVRENETLELSCQTTSDVFNQEFEWLIDRLSCRTVSLDNSKVSNILIIYNVPMSFNDCSVTCVVKLIGRATVTIRVMSRIVKTTEMPVTLSTMSTDEMYGKTIPIAIESVIVIASCLTVFILIMTIVCVLRRKINNKKLSNQQNVNVQSKNEDLYVDTTNENIPNNLENTSPVSPESTNSEDQSLCSGIVYENVQLDNGDSENAAAECAPLRRLNYVELDLRSSSVVHNNTQPTLYSDIVLS